MPIGRLQKFLEGRCFIRYRLQRSDKNKNKDFMLMEKCRYLYGASIQGIQSFIFQTDRLKDIVGASELVEQACTEVFRNEFFDEKTCELIVSAAGNVKCVFPDENMCRKAVLSFPKRVMEKAPGVTISQAVVRMTDDFSGAIDELERRLHSQRNRRSKPLAFGLMAMERCRRTGMPSINTIGAKDRIDEGCYLKGKALVDSANSKGATSKLYEKLYGCHVSLKNATDMATLTGQNDWIAIVHADGNGLGEVVANIGKNPGKLKQFSEKLNEATIKSAQTACKECLGDTNELLVRPVVIGGDDLTVVCRASIAVDFVNSYLRNFEKNSLDLTNHALTACAGIAFIKSSYPFSYGYNLAETLCGVAKKDAKSAEMKRANGGKAPSCLMFHKVQSSFIEDYGVIERKELTASCGSSFRFGPYYLDEQEDRWTIDKLQLDADALSKESNNAIKTSVREWLTLMGESRDKALQKENRVNMLDRYTGEQKKLFAELTTERKGKRFPAYDVLALQTIKNQVTK